MNAARKTIRLIGTPYLFGIRGESMGQGPIALLEDSNVPRMLEDEGISYGVSWVEADEPVGKSLQMPVGDQMSRTMRQNYILRDLVAQARADGEFPIMLSGTCSTSMGVVGGLDDPELGLIWLDGHADASTPETSASGFFEGMPVAILNGQCWKDLRESVPGFHTISSNRILSVGMHDLQANRPGPIGHVVDREYANENDGWYNALSKKMDQVSGSMRAVYLHIDTDVLDAKIAEVHEYAGDAVGGLTDSEVRDTIQLAFEKFDVRAVNFTAFNPRVDPRALSVISNLVSQAAVAASRSHTPTDGSCFE